MPQSTQLPKKTFHSEKSIANNALFPVVVWQFYGQCAIGQIHLSAMKHNFMHVYYYHLKTALFFTQKHIKFVSMMNFYTQLLLIDIFDI